MNSGQDNPPKHKSTKPSGIGWKYFTRPHIFTRTILHVIFLRLQKKGGKKTRFRHKTLRINETNEWIINSALYIGTKKGCNLILTYFRVVFTSFGWTKRTSKWRNKREARSYSIVAFIFDRGEEREHVEGVIDDVLNR